MLSQMKAFSKCNRFSSSISSIYLSRVHHRSWPIFWEKSQLSNNRPTRVSMCKCTKKNYKNEMFEYRPLCYQLRLKCHTQFKVIWFFELDKKKIQFWMGNNHHRQKNDFKFWNIIIKLNRVVLHSYLSTS